MPDGWKEEKTIGKKRKAEGDEGKNRASKNPKLTKTTAELKEQDSIINPPTNLTKTTANREKRGVKQPTANRKDQGSTTTRPPWKP